MTTTTTTRGRWRAGLGVAVRVLLSAVLTAVVVLLIATVVGRDQQQLAQRVDRNAQISRTGIATLVCILTVNPESRTNAVVRDCLRRNGYADTDVTFLPRGLLR